MHITSRRQAVRFGRRAGRAFVMSFLTKGGYHVGLIRKQIKDVKKVAQDLVRDDATTRRWNLVAQRAFARTAAELLQRHARN